MRKVVFTLTLLVALLASYSRADSLATYRFNGSSRASTDNDPNSTATSFNDGSGWTSTLDTKRGNAADSVSVASKQTSGDSQAGAVSAGDYFTFTITPTSGFALDLSTLSFDFANFKKHLAKKFSAENFFVRSSMDGFASDIGSMATASKASAGKFGNTSINLGSAFDNVTGPIEFRIYVQDNANGVRRGALLDNISLNGTTVDMSSLTQVPEPAVWMLMGVGLLIGAQRLRRKR